MNKHIHIHIDQGKALCLLSVTFVQSLDNASTQEQSVGRPRNKVSEDKGARAKPACHKL